MATYNDYPQSATNNAKKVLEWKKKYGSEVKGMTSVGWTRANQLAKREKLSYKTIARMAAFNRHRKNATVDPKYKSTPWKDRGYVAWLGWGGTSGVNWAIKKAESLRNNNSEFDAEFNEEIQEIMNELPLFDISLNDFVEGMYKISLVDKPAIEENFLYFSKEEKKLHFADEEKRELVGPIMIPNKPILRFSPDRGYYNVQFTPEIIKEIMYKYSKDGLFNSFGINHAFDTHDVVMLEVWMKESDNDKSRDYGYDLPNGTVFVKTKIESDELFKAIKDGEINGFSIEIEANIEPSKNKEEMNEFSFAKELGKMEAQFESTIETMLSRIEALEAANEQLTEQLSNFSVVTEEESTATEATEEVFEEVSEETAVELEMNEETPSETEEVVNEEMSAEGETVENVEEEFSAEEEVNEEQVEMEFSALQNEEEVEETVENVLEFNGITPEKVALVNNFFSRFK